ncbi:response regulator [Dehalococcoides mccartyi]|uniref:response regulator n=1 Tax=Dehalococcoides mccartyi TaxID=61435 RepID=UPI0006BD6AA8|nr:response regulator [Dehalococcoides mccartyi]BAS31270.1 response regulator receiver protein [Dehalococcoides mccartyi IBARAKI]
MSKIKILIADDEEHIRQLVCSILDKGYQIVQARNGEEAVKESREQNFDLILMDIIMPKLDGLAACCMLKGDKQTSSTPIIMLTGVGYELNKKLSQQLGADGYITKPFNPQELRNKVSEFIKHD